MKKVHIEDGLVYLNVPFADKEQAKKVGCRWNPEKKQWYCRQDHISRMKDQWLGFKPESNTVWRQRVKSEKQKASELAKAELTRQMQESNRTSVIVYGDIDDFTFNGRYWYRQTANLDIWAEG